MKLVPQILSLESFHKREDILLNDYPHVVRLYVLDLKSVL